jgi:hypothetical protein
MPLWPAIALWISGAVIVIVDTADLLFFVGLAMIAIGFWAWWAHRTFVRSTSSG